MNLFVIHRTEEIRNRFMNITVKERRTRRDGGSWVWQTTIKYEEGGYQ
jgi:hypothetical protein